MWLETSRASKRGLRCSSLRLRPLSKVSGPRPGGVDADRTVRHPLQPFGSRPRLEDREPGVHPLEGR